MGDMSPHRGLPSALLDALRSLHDGGLLSAVALAEPRSAVRPWIPCFLVRVPVLAQFLPATNVTLTTQLVVYEEEGPLVIFNLLLQEHSGMVGDHVMRERMRQVLPFELECFLNPTVDEGRLMLQALESSFVVTIEFYGTDRAMTYQATRQYPHSFEERKVIRKMVQETAGIVSSQHRFLAAKQRFLREHPFFPSGDHA